MGYKKFNKKDNSSMITFVGNIVDTTDDLLKINKDKDILDKLMRCQSSAMRTSYVDISKRNLSRKESTDKTTDRFIKNVRYMRDAYVLAEQNITSQKALIPTYIEDCLKCIKKTETKIDKLQKSKRALKSKKKKTIDKGLVLKKLTRKLNKLKNTLKTYENHIENDTCPPAVFGGKANVKLLKSGKITKDEWVNSRTNTLYSVGEKSKGGNENIKLSHLHDNFFEMKVLNPFSEKKGDRLKFIVSFPEKMTPRVKNHLSTGEAYTVRIIRNNNKYSVHVTISSLTALDEELLKLGVAEIDINPDNISVAIIDAKGNFKYSKIFKFPEINYVSSDRRNHIIGNTVQSVVNYIKSMGVKVIIIEDLKFSNSYDNNSNMNRLLSNFVHSKIVNQFGSRCYKEDMVLKKVNPAYTSLMGRIKYQKRFGLSIHESASLCIARKGLGLKEKIPKNILKEFFAMEVKGQIKISQNKYIEYWKDLYQFINNSKFRASIRRLDPFHLQAMGIKRHPKEWYLEDFMIYAEKYILGLLSQIFLLQHS